MLRVSLALAVLALVSLVAGFFQDGLALIYVALLLTPASIALLVVAVAQRVRASRHGRRAAGRPAGAQGAPRGATRRMPGDVADVPTSASASPPAAAERRAAAAREGRGRWSDTAPLTSADPASLGPYRLLARLGSGGHGTVYLARSPTGRPVAVKALKAGSPIPEARRRFEREVELAMAASSPWSARILDADVSADPPWFAAEYAAGPTLRASVDADGPLADDALRGLAAGLAAALAALHEHQVVHRDVKPDNVVLTEAGPRLVDLGIATTTGGTRLTSAGSVIGTEGWLTPEQLGGGDVGPASDVFAWACVVAYAASGTPPFGGGGLEAVGFRVLTADPDLPPLPPGLEPLVRASLAKDPAGRPTADEVARALFPARSAPAFQREVTVAWSEATRTRVLGPESPTMEL